MNNDVFTAELHGKWMARADSLTEEARRMNHHLADIAASLRTIASALQVTMMIAVPPDPQSFSPPKGDPS